VPPREVTVKGKDQTGKNGEDLIIRVPAGTLVQMIKRGSPPGPSLRRPTICGAEGRWGGRGNARLPRQRCVLPAGRKGRERTGASSSTGTEAPRRCGTHRLSERREIHSPLQSLICRPKIRGLSLHHPDSQLACGTEEDTDPFEVADIPGLTKAPQKEPARFDLLRHVERTRLSFTCWMSRKDLLAMR